MKLAASYPIENKGCESGVSTERSRRADVPHVLPYLPSFSLRFFLLLISVPSDLFSSDAEAESGPEIDGQRGIADDFVVAAVEGVLDVRIGCDAGVDGIPSADIDANVTGSVVDPQAEKVGIRPATDETASQICPPASAKITQQERGRVLRTT